MKKTIFMFGLMMVLLSAGAMVNADTRTDILADAIMLWELNEGSGTKAEAYMHNINLTFTGSAAWGSGIVGSGVHIPGSSFSGMNTTDGAPDKSLNMTYCWAMNVSGNSAYTLFDDGSTISESPRVRVDFPNQKITWTFYKNGLWNVSVGSTLPFTASLNTWHTYCISQNQTDRISYFDGNKVNVTSGNTSGVDTRGWMAIGQYYTGTGNLNGDMDEILITNRSLSDSEISFWHDYVYNQGCSISDPSCSSSLDFYDSYPANASEHAYTSTGQSLGFDFNITGATGLYTCNLTRNGSTVASNAFNASLNGTFTLYDTYNDELNYTEYEYDVVCAQGATTLTDTNKTIYIMVDTVQPTINFIYPTDGYTVNLTSGSPDLIVNVSVNDSNLYNSTFTLYYGNGSIVNQTNVFHNLSSTYYQWNFSQSLYSAGSQEYNMSVESCDGHTKNHIDEWEDIGKADGSIIFGDCRIYPDALMKDIGSYDYHYEGDRYTWSYEWLKSDTTRSYFLECAAGSDIIYLPQSGYKGHFVEYSTKRWLDFETPEDYPTTVTKLTGNKWRITYTGVDNSIVTTRSIGELNCNNASITFDVLVKSNITFISQDPADITNTNIFAQRVNITYDITDPDGMNTSVLYWKTNTSSTDGGIYLNGSLLEGYSTGLTDVSNVSDTWEYLLSDNAVLPGVYNIYEEYMEDEPSLYHNLSSPSQYAAVTLIGVSSSKTYNVLELSLDNSTSTSTVADIYYCNSSYGFSMSPAATSSCALVYTMSATEPYNHTDDKLVPLAISGGELNGVDVTSTSYIVIGPSGTDTWQWRYISNMTRADTSRYSADSGASWSNLSGTFDAHLHQYSGSDTFWYIASAQDIDGDWTNSTARSDLLDLGGLPPADMVFIYPLGGETVGFGTDMDIDWTDAVSPNGYTIGGYNLTLYYSNGSVYSVLDTNISDSNYTYDTSLALEDDFYLIVDVCDNISQCSSEQSGTFTVMDVNGTASVTVNDSTPYVNETVLFTWNYSDNNPDSVSFILNCSDVTVYTNTTDYTGTYEHTQNTTGTCTAWLWGNDTLGSEWEDSVSAVFGEPYISATGNFTVGSCPNTDTPTMLMYAVMLMFAYALIVIGWTMRVPFMVMLGGICLLILSWYTAGCIPLIGFVMAGAGILMIAWSMVKRMRG